MLGTTLPFRMCGKDNRVAAFKREHGIAHGGDNGICNWRNAANNANWFGNINKSFFTVFAKNAAADLAFKVIPYDG